MSRLRRFEAHRFLGDRSTMIAYDCDDQAEFDVLQALVEAGDLVNNNLIQTFAPDELSEAVNRSFHPLN